MPIQNKATAILDAAASSTPRYGVGGFCCYNAEGILATVRAAEAKRSPAMILLFPWALQFAGGDLVAFAARVARNAKVPITVHLDHAQTPEIVKQAAELSEGEGFDSIMVDMSHYEKEENLRLTHELTEFCHARGIATEAEPGRIEGGEDGVKDTADLEGVLTTKDEARLFVDTSIDWLAPAIGNVHGNYGPRGIVLEYDRLEGIFEEVGNDVRLVLHGSDPMDKSILQNCIQRGVVKVNLNKPVNIPFQKVMAERAGRIPFTQLLEEGTAAMQKSIEDCIDKLGSSDKA